MDNQYKEAGGDTSSDYILNGDLSDVEKISFISNTCVLSLSKEELAKRHVRCLELIKKL
ncbi:MAG: hypothetical protein K0B02_02410 [DPANN group archaeon]|nr:hypothetical protein [DPANN group archaeon]